MLRLRADLMVGSILLLMLCCMSVAACGAQKGSGKKQSRPTQEKPVAVETPLPTPAREGKGEKMSGELKVLTEGRYSSVGSAFVAVVRDAESYAELRALIDALPEMSADFFKSNVVVAAFLGGRRTGGYGVQITQATEGLIRISESVPPKGAITTQALTAPYKIVSVPLPEQTSLVFETGEAWVNASRPYRVRGGQFNVSGGFAGRMERFTLEGELRTSRLDKLLSIAFALKTTGNAKPRALQTIATGIADTSGFVIRRLEGGSLVEWPNGGLRATGKFNRNEDNLSINFEPLPSDISDSFGGAGKLEANATAPAPAPPRTPRPMDEPM
ncbi:MAG TPA: protease complex subunit PrcB family protein [Pyrinomonadaceae bacterium]|jgi:hypothetical protein